MRRLPCPELVTSLTTGHQQVPQIDGVIGLNHGSINIDLTLILLTMAALVGASVCAVMTKSLLKAAIALGIASAVLTMTMFLMDAQLAAVFELSVCAGLVTVVFISAISLTKPQTRKEMLASARNRRKRYVLLPLLLLVTAAGMYAIKPVVYEAWTVNGKVEANSGSAGTLKALDTDTVGTGDTTDAGAVGSVSVRKILWDTRRVDMLGQVIIILTGAIGVTVLVKGRDAG